MKQEWDSSIQKAMWGCVLAHLSRYITQNCISVDQLTLNWKSEAHKQKYTLCCHCVTDTFQEHFLDKVMGVKGRVDFMEGFTQIQRLVRRAFMCVCVFCLVLPH
jgi:hypothetical protein